MTPFFSIPTYCGDAEKPRFALDVFREHFEAENLVISTQVVQEFYVTVTRKLAVPPTQLLRAADLAVKFRILYWDALILAAAEAAGASVLLSEDFSHDRLYGSVRVRNPLLPA